MKRLALVLLALSLCSAAHAQTVPCDDAQIAVATTPTIEQSPARYKKAISLQPYPNRPSDLIVIGDSIARHWDAFARRDFPNAGVRDLGVGGERTQELIWRLRSATTRGNLPKAVILIIGTNNLTDKAVAACGVANGVLGVVDDIAKLWPGARILVMPILPRGKDFRFRDNDRLAVNDLLRQNLQERPNATLVNVPEAELTCEMRPEACQNYRPDRLHLTSSGYDILREAVMPDLATFGFRSSP